MRIQTDEEKMPTNDKPKIVMYTTKWCPNCWMAKRVMASMGVAYDEINISHDPDAAAIVERINRGYRSVPTLIFPDGSTLTEPRPAELSAKLSLML